ncbi:MAG: hypothetical protein JNL05_12915 [Flavobacteriales bacterium]|nr:hypothetical protein [Flavobacteriales bacterium]
MAKKKNVEDRAAELAGLVEKGAEALAQQVLDLQDELAAAKEAGDTAELERQVQDLTERLAAVEATKGDKRPVVKVKGKQCLIVAAHVLHEGKKLPAAEVAQNPKLLEELLDSGSSLLQVIKA